MLGLYRTMRTAIKKDFPGVSLLLIRRYIIFTTISVIVFTAAYYALMDQSIKYSDAINADFKRLSEQVNSDPKKPDKITPPTPVPEAPAGWLYLGNDEVLAISKREHDLLSALYFSLSVQSTLGPPHYPPNRAWKLLTGIHILFVLAATVLAMT
jgi:hypothetical protein